MKIETSTAANSKEQSPNPPARLRIESKNLVENRNERSPTQIEIREDLETPTTNTLLEKQITSVSDDEEMELENFRRKK